MELTGVGSGIMIALAAGLWLVYLVPSWLRSREFSATERNAVRLQQTLRVLAETADVPNAVRAETTARGVLEQEKLVKRQQRQRANAERAMREATRPVASAATRLRRTRAVTSLVLLAAIVVLAIEVPTAFIAGLSSTGFAVVLFAGIALVSAAAMLSRLNDVARSRRTVAAPVQVQAPVARRAAPQVRTADVAPAQVTWTPVPIPKPLYLSRDVVDAPVVTAASIAAELDRAAVASERALRAAQAEVPSIPMRPVAEPAAAPSRFASMGKLTDGDIGRTDIDEVLRRRRAAG